MEQPKDAISVPTRITITKNPLLAIDAKIKKNGKKETYTNPAASNTQYHFAD